MFPRLCGVMTRTKFKTQPGNDPLVRRDVGKPCVRARARKSGRHRPEVVKTGENHRRPPLRSPSIRPRPSQTYACRPDGPAIASLIGRPSSVAKHPHERPYRLPFCAYNAGIQASFFTAPGLGAPYGIELPTPWNQELFWKSLIKGR